jgi:hypothetical protein
MKSIVFLMPWYGAWPAWLELYLESCRFNPTVNWIIFTDLERPAGLPDNVRHAPLSREDFSLLVERRLGLTGYALERPYKLCDFRPCFGRLFEDHIQGYDYFGFGDLDVVYGNLRRFLTDEVLSHSLVSCHQHRISGHCCLLANTEANRNLHLTIRHWRAKLLHPRFIALEDQMKLDPATSLFFESYNTPFVPGMPWRSGREEYPKEWYWNKGRLTNDLDEGESLYFHFMIWKGGRWGRKYGGAQFESLDKLVHQTEEGVGWRINERGFWRPR